ILSVCVVFVLTASSLAVIFLLSLHDALPICDGRLPRHVHGGSGQSRRRVCHRDRRQSRPRGGALQGDEERRRGGQLRPLQRGDRDRKSTRLNSSHEWISYAVFCLKKKTK